jgi:lysophospholipase L1-like esterase
MRVFNIMMALLVSVLIGFGIFEGGLRLTSFAPEESGNRFDAELGWSKEPNVVVERSRSEFDVIIAINEHGLRDDPMPTLAKPEEVFRIVCLGDSFTMGYTVNRDNLFVDLLERWWQAEGRSIEIINAGVEGYSTDQSARWLELHAAEFDPDLVLYFPYENDIYWNGEMNYLRFPKPRYMPAGRREARKLEDPGPHAWTENWATTKALKALAGALRGSKDGPQWFVPAGSETPMPREFAPLLTEQPDFLIQDPKNPIGRTQGSLIAMEAAATDVGAQLVVVPIPSQSDVSPSYAAQFGSGQFGLQPDQWDPARPVDLFLDLAKAEGIKTFDVRSTFKALIADGKHLYYQMDWHLNPSGNRALARYLYNEFDSAQNQVLPTSYAAKTVLRDPPKAASDFPPFWLVLYGVLVVVLTGCYKLTYRTEALVSAMPKIAGMLALVFVIFMGAKQLVLILPPNAAGSIITLVIVGIVGFMAYKLGRRMGTISELVIAFIKRGHWYLLPLLVVLLSIGSLLVVAASSPFVAPFIYTLF